MSLRLITYCDADWGGCQTTRLSVTSYCVFIGKSLILWKTKKQPTMSRSSSKAEYRAMATITCELTWLRYIFKELGVQVLSPAKLYYDNRAALHIVVNPPFHERTKHIEMDCHVVRDKIKWKQLTIAFTNSKIQIADMFTKPLGKSGFQFHLSKLGIHDIHTST